MRLTKKLETEILKVYNTYWESYSNGDIKTFAGMLDETFELIGTSESEICHTKEDGIKFLRAQVKELGGKVEMRNRKISVVPVNELMLVNERCNIYFLSGQDWRFYSKIRISTFLRKTSSGWKVFHQHGSFPDMQVQEGETLAVKKINKENLQLRDAIKRRTIELEEKNRELEIETALEKVRAVAMSMKRREDMLQICKTISQQLAKLGVKETRNVQTAIFNVPQGTYMNYEYYAKHNKTFITETLYTNHKVARAFAAKMLKGRGEVSITHIKGRQKVKEWLNYQKGTNVFIDSYLNKATSLTYYWYSLGPVALGISTYFPLTKEEQQLFSRFLKVFELAYRRYLDIEKAEAQAREAQIEAALERIRAASLAMRDSSALSTIIFRLYAELTKLDAKLDRCFIMIVNPENKGITWWMAGQEGLLAENGFFVQMNQHASHLMYLDYCKQRKKKWTYLFEGKEKKDWDRFGFSKTELARLPEPVKAFMSAAKKVYLSGSSDQFGSLVTGSFEPLPEEQQDIISRFATVFNQTYTRFLDLQRAEAQAREAQIEAALERVRSRSLAMHKSEELKEVIRMVLEQFIQLNIKAEHAGFYIDYKAHDDMHIWLADPNLEPFYAVIPYFDTPTWNSFLEAKAKRITLHTDLLDFKTKNKFYRSLFKLFAIPEEAREFYLKCKGLAVSTVLLDSVGLYIENFDGTPYTDEENNILIRFGKVFQQAYTRFLDLQKAEAQAREAQIEAALERVRSRTMAMHRSEEIAGIVGKIFGELKQLDLVLNRVLIWIFNDEDKYITWWSANPEMENNAESYRIDYNEQPVFLSYLQAWQKRTPLHLYTLSGDLKKNWEDHLFENTELAKLPISVRKGMREEGTIFTTSTISDYGLMMVGSFEPLLEENIDIIQRFGRVFQQSYTRYLDVQKAEAQAREAQIQLALERVRARTMAMQKSNELPQAASLLFQQLQTLGMPAFAAGYCIWDDEPPVGNGKNSITLWMSSEGILQPPFKAPTTEDELFIEMRKGFEQGKSLHVVEMGGEDLVAHYKYMRTLPVVGRIFDSIVEAGHSLPVFQVMHQAYFSKGFLLIIAYEPVPESHDIFKRFANVFEQTYTRFLDLQKAEAQAREAQIEAALERVRSRSMAMHKSEELADLSLELVKQVQSLGVATWFCAFNIYDNDPQGSLEWGSNGQGTFPRYRTPREGIFLRYYEAGQRGETLFINEIGEKECPAHYEYLCSLPGVGDQLLKMKAAGIPFPASQIDHVAFFKYGYLLFISYEPVPESHDIFIRFAKVFEQTYTRFLDLQKAEAQAREAKIEAALERVRSQAMAMRQSADLLDIVVTMRNEFTKLGHEAHYFWYMRWLPDKYEKAMTSGDGTRIGMVMTLPRHIHGDIKLVADWEKGDEPTLVFAMDVETAVDYVDKMINLGDFEQVDPQAPTLDDIRHIGGLTFIMARTMHGEIGYSLPGVVPNPPPDDIKTLVRFAGVFDLAYRRFEDLKLAEQKNRETEIELALEKVRSRTMAMQKSEELGDVATVLFKELNVLVKNLWTCGFVLCEKNRSQDEWWISTEGGFIPAFYLPNTGDVTHENIYKGWLNGEVYHTEQLEGEALQQHYDWLMTIPVAKKIFEEMSAAGYEKPEWQKLHCAYFSKGYLCIITREPCAEEEIFKRFASVFDLTYTRFLDLQKAEAQTREALIEGALERVRARALAMQEPEELKEVAQVMRNEMGALGVEELETSSIYIYGDNSENVECWYALQDPKQAEKKMVADYFMLDLDETWVGREMKTFYLSDKKQTSVIMQGANRREWIDYCYKHSPVFSGFYGEAIPDRTYHLYKFSHGYIGAAAPGEISVESWRLLSRAASVFSLAYSRFKDLTQARIDLQRLKEEKQRAETALTDLQATQKQLVQSEKMASLGELTAGIAHEIQNPLNFVNNFSEVSKELLDEMKEAIEKGDTEDAKEIMNDVIQNLEKINHHGKRADSIVKGMLQHSRSSTGQKELTDINALCDEYLRLAYHGLRAKDTSFNAKFETQFDETVDKLNVIPQDIGRVVLNLINNAFYAVSERKKLSEPGYEPTVSVSTYKNGNTVVIGVRDNGTGIPQKVLDKIFQPFFTTKPTGLGTGLGLSLSYDIITKGHGGELKVETKEGEGTEFFILLPL